MFEVEEVRVVVVHQFTVGVGGEVIREKEVRISAREGKGGRSVSTRGGSVSA